MVPSCFCQPFLWSPTVTNSSRLPTMPRHLLKRSDATKPSWNQDSWQSWSLEKKFRASTQMMSRASLKRSTKLSISSRPSLSTWSVSPLTYARRIVRRDYERKFWAGLKINSISEAWPMCIPLYISLWTSCWINNKCFFLKATGNSSFALAPPRVSLTYLSYNKNQQSQIFQNFLASLFFLALTRDCSLEC